jgi:quercetin dioxygenase-like cupin family protein
MGTTGGEAITLHGGMIEGAPASPGRVLPGPRFQGVHICASDWHVMAIYLAITDIDDGPTNVGESRRSWRRDVLRRRGRDRSLPLSDRASRLQASLRRSPSARSGSCDGSAFGHFLKEELVERFSFASEVAFVPRGDLLDRVTVAPLTSPLSEGAPIQAAIFRFAPGGGLLRHPSTYPQILAVLEGSGIVSGVDGIEEPIVAGEAVFWHEGEEHQSKSAHGLTALIIEGDTLDRFRKRPGPAI